MDTCNSGSRVVKCAAIKGPPVLNLITRIGEIYACVLLSYLGSLFVPPCNLSASVILDTI